MSVGVLNVSGFEIIPRRTTLGRTPLDQSLVHRKDFYLSTHNTHKRQTSMSLTGFEPIISASELPHSIASERVIINGVGIFM
jgi:hypothetical protein